MLPLTWVKLSVRPDVSTELNNFLTLVNNGKAFSSLDGMVCATSVWPVSVSIRSLASQGIGFLETLKNPANLFKNNLNNTRNNMKPQIQNNNNINNNNNNNSNNNINNNNNNNNNGGIVELLIPTFF